MKRKIYTREEVQAETLIYFKGNELASNVWIDKYCLKQTALDGGILYYELTPEAMHRRLAKEFARIESKYPNAMDGEEIFQLLKDFAYIIPQGSPQAGIGNPFAITSISNCFVVGGQPDSYGGIMNLGEEGVQLMKRRGGVGNSMEFIRPSGAMANSAALGPNAGMPLYMDRYSNDTREVQQDGRRGARMLSIHIKHPDAEKFIDKKMIAGQVTGANISVKITDEFIKACDSNTDFFQVFPVKYSIYDVVEEQSIENEIHIGDSIILESLEYDKLCAGKVIDGIQTYYKKIDPKRLQDKLVYNAWKSAEPGSLFWDKIISESPAKGYGAIWAEISTNPCFTGDTLVAVADGRQSVSLKQLADEREDVPVYCSDKNGDTVIRMMRSPRVTGFLQKIYRVKLDNGESIRATENHPFYLNDLKDGRYPVKGAGRKVKLKDLRPGDSLKIMSKNYLKSSSNTHIDINSNSREITEHKLICIENGTYQRGKDIHHTDEDPFNNTPSNLQILTKAEHNTIHNKTYSGSINGNFSGISTERYKQIAVDATKSKMGKLTVKEFLAAGGCNYSKWRADEIGVKTLGLFLSQIAEATLELENHRVVSIEFDKIEDVYNGTVDEFHNYFVGGFEEKSRKVGNRRVVFCQVANCGEIPLPAYDSCRLLLINLMGYVFNAFGDNAMLEDQLLTDHVKKAQRLMDDIVDLEIEKIDTIITSIKLKNSKKEYQTVELNLWTKIRNMAEQGRRTGLGVTAEGDLIAALGYQYGTPETTLFSEKLHQLIATASYESSIELAEERGAFPIWNTKADSESGFLQRMFSDDNELMTPEIFDKYLLYGRRNIANLTIAPAGSISIIAMSEAGPGTTSGFEPLFSPFHFRKKKITNETTWDYEDENGDKWIEFPVFHNPFIQWYSVARDISIENARLELESMSKKALDKLVLSSPYFQATAQDVDYIEKVRMQGAVQKWIDHSISVTVNMPENVTVETVAEVYKVAHESGCKGITVYRDNSRGNVLSTKSIKGAVEEFDYVSAEKRDDILDCDIFHKTKAGEDFIILVGKKNSKPYEIFVLPAIQLEISKTIKRGSILKSSKGKYDLLGDNDMPLVDDITSYMIESEQNSTRNFSAMLRHRMDPKFIVDMISRYASISSFHKVVGKVLKTYIEVEEIKCPQKDCGGIMRMTEGCVKCPDCGYSHCD